MRVLRRLLVEDEAQGIIEYGLLVGGVALGLIFSFVALSGQLLNVMGHAQNQLTQIPTN